MPMESNFHFQITGMRVNTDNRAATGLDVFFGAIEKRGFVPSRVRGDRGGENTEVAVTMVLLRGANRASFLWGS